MKAKSKVHEMALIGLMASIICILGPLSIPIGLVPVSLTNLAIFFALYVLGMKRATVSFLIYLLIGLVGLPVFSNYSGGLAKLLGPTGGYIFGFFFMALIAGYFIDKDYNNKFACFMGMLLGTAVLYIFGTIWLSYQANLSISAALAAGVIPFIPGDLFKILVAAFIGPKIRERVFKYRGA
jgi:biotin transport system substrate-specific component